MRERTAVIFSLDIGGAFFYFKAEIIPVVFLRNSRFHSKTTGAGR
jgi:hypothetical protein